MAQVWSCSSTLPPLPAVERGFATVISGSEAAGKLIYTNGRAVVMRSLARPFEDCEAIYMHTTNATCARFSPSGEWVASGDAAGGVKVWSAAEANGERAVKNDIPVLGGAITDLQWAPDGKKIVAVGNGRGRLAKCFAWDRGSNFGDFDGLSSKVNSCDFRPTDPFRIVTGSEDFRVNVYGGPPFKFLLSNKKHTNFVNCVRYSPDGSRYVSVSSDKKCIVYDGETGEPIQEFATGGDAHTGSIMACAWSPDSAKLITASADKTVKVWDMQNLKLSSTVKMGSKVEDMQLGCCWVGDHVVSLSLSGNLNYLDLGAGKVRTTVMGHTKGLTTLATGAASKFFTSSYDGRVCEWDGSARCKSSAVVHTNMPVSMEVSGTGDSLYSCGFDDTYRITSLPLRGDATSVETTKLSAQPKDSAYSKATDTVCLVYERKVELLKGTAVFCSLDLDQEASSCALSPSGQVLALGTKAGKVVTYGIHGGSTLTKDKTLERHRGEVTAVAFSHDGALLASGDTNREVLVWDCNSGEVKKSRMVYHSSKITSLSWSPSGDAVCSGSVDSSVIVWPLDLPTSKRTTLALAHQEGVKGVAYLSDDKIASVGTDGCCKIWTKA